MNRKKNNKTFQLQNVEEKKEKKSTGMQFNKPKKTTNREEKFNFFFSICISSQKPYTGFYTFLHFKPKNCI